MTLLAGVIFGCLCVRFGIKSYEKNIKISQGYIALGLIGFFAGAVFFLINIAGLALNLVQALMFIAVVVTVGTRNISISLHQSLENKHRVVTYF